MKKKFSYQVVFGSMIAMIVMIMGMAIANRLRPEPSVHYIHDLETKKTVIREPVKGMILEGIFYPVGSVFTSEENGDLILAQDTTPDYLIIGRITYDSAYHMIKFILK